MREPREGGYGKEIVGALLWAALLYYLFTTDSFPGCEDKSLRLPFFDREAASETR